MMEAVNENNSASLKFHHDTDQAGSTMDGFEDAEASSGRLRRCDRGDVKLISIVRLV